MLKSSKERILAGILLTIVGLSCGHDMINAMLFDPLDSKQQQVAALLQTIQDRSLEFQRIQHAQRSLAEVRVMSLPADPHVATAYYQEWLVTVADRAGVRDAQVAAGRPVEIEPAGHRIPFTLQGDMTPSQLGTICDEIRSTPLLHSVRHLTVSAEGQGDARSLPNVTIGIEAIALETATDRERLLDPAAAELDVAVAETSLHRFFSSHDLFSAAPLPADVPKRSTREQLPSRSVPSPVHFEFIAGMAVNGVAEAWLYDREGDERLTLRYEHPVSFAGTKIETLEIRRDQVTIAVNGKQATLVLGDAIQLTSR